MLPLIPYSVNYLFRPDYPDAEGGDSEGRKIGIGYSSVYNAALRGKRGEPVRISRGEFRALCERHMSNAEFHRYLNELVFRNGARAV